MQRSTRPMTTTEVRLEALPDHRRARRPRAGGAGPTSSDAPGPRPTPRRPEPTPSPLPRNLVGVSVLVVDDDETTLEFLAAALSYCGAQVTTAAAAGEALMALRQARPDVVLSDIAM